MKPNRLLLLSALLLTLVSCQSTEQAAYTETKSTPSAAVQNIEPHETATEITVVSIRDTTPKDMELPDAEEPFWEDASYIYIFANPISEYVTVEYSDGSTQNVKEALTNGMAGTSDLDRFGIQYYKDEKEPQTPCDYGSGVEAFDSVREMIRQIENGTMGWTAQEIYNAHGCDTGALRELTGIDDGFSEFLVEWCGGLNYSIYYHKDEQVIVFTPFYTKEQLVQSLSGLDTWESLAENKRILNLVKTDSETEDGILYECTYDTDKVKGLRNTYHDTTGTDGIRRIVSNWYGAAGEHISGSIYIYNEEIPFQCLISGFEADMDFAKQLGTKHILTESDHYEN